MRFVRTLIAAAALFLGPLLVACATVPPASVAAARPALVRAEAAYARIDRVVAIVLPMLPPDRAARVRAAQALTARALEAARTAVTAAELLAAVRAAERGTDAVATAAGA